MPGVVGLLTMQPRGWAEYELHRMVESLRHESPYATGTWVDESLGVYIGWVARKDSFCDDMPLRNERGDTLLFSGEEFADPRAKDCLRRRGCRFDAEGASYLVHLYEGDPRFFAGLNGRFHGLLVDQLHQTATLFNDRYGMHRLYYHASRDVFYFAAESKAILLVRPELRRVDPRSLGEFIACGCVMEDRTLFEGIHVLPAASAWIFRGGSLQQKQPYFQGAEWEEQPPLAAEPFYREFREVFSRNLPRYFEGRERVGMSLTGGLDTRMILAWHKPLPRSLPCYTFGGIVRDCHDVRVARQVARASEQPHEVIPVGQEFLSRFPHYAERTVYLTDGCVDVNYSPDLYVNEVARQIAPVRMTGNYGGEVLRRVIAFQHREPLPGLFRPELLPHTRQAAETLRSALQEHPLSFAVFRQAPWHHYGLLALEQSQVSLRSPYLDNDLVRLAFRAPPEALASDDLCWRLIADGDPVLARIPTDRGLGGPRGRLAILMSHGRSVFSRKAEYAYDHGMPQCLARLDHLLRPLRLERLFLGRHKFSHFRIWYRDHLAPYVQDILLDPRTLTRSYLDRVTVEAVVRGHIKGDRNYTTEIHRLLTLELLHRLFVDPL
jgi:asparagine synthase (glutamine-hydrolysing)